MSRSGIITFHTPDHVNGIYLLMTIFIDCNNHDFHIVIGLIPCKAKIFLFTLSTLALERT
jgi:hypothetical protein